jgi:hypothetical protein
MAEHASVIGPEFLSSQTSVQGLTPKIWLGIDRSRGIDPFHSFFHVDHGQNGVGNFTSTQATAGTALWIASPVAGWGSVLELDCNSTTNTQGIQVQYPGLGVYPSDGMIISYESMLLFKDIGTNTGPEFFDGLATLDTTLIASGSISAADWIGLYSSDGTPALKFGVEDGTQDISAVTAHTTIDGDVTAASWFRWGFRWEVGTKIDVYVNGREIDSSDVAESNAPDGPIVCSSVCQSNGTTDPIVLSAYRAFGYTRA